MTRVNVGYPVRKLTRLHLLAEHREIVRIPNALLGGNIRKPTNRQMNRIPKQFCLGPGHVRFFYDKLLYLRKRYEQIYKECIRRGYNVQYYGSSWVGAPVHLYKDWKPTKSAKRLIEKRIRERLRGKSPKLVVKRRKKRR